jgi:anti-sigma regulatory factor (Ser/Thr protein kinase)
MSTVTISFSPDPAYVRTVRLVAAAVARRAGVSDDLLGEVRLAIGEACARAVALHRRHGLTELISVAMRDGGGFTVTVTDRGPAGEQLEPGLADVLPPPNRDARSTGVPSPAPAGAADPVGTLGAAELVEDEDALAAGVSLTLLTGLVSDLEVVAADGEGTQVRMSWPVGRRLAN